MVSNHRGRKPARKHLFLAKSFTTCNAERPGKVLRNACRQCSVLAKQLCEKAALVGRSRWSTRRNRQCLADRPRTIARQSMPKIVEGQRIAAQAEAFAANPLPSQTIVSHRVLGVHPVAGKHVQSELNCKCQGRRQSGQAQFEALRRSALLVCTLSLSPPRRCFGPNPYFLPRPRLTSHGLIAPTGYDSGPRALTYAPTGFLFYFMMCGMRGGLSAQCVRSCRHGAATMHAFMMPFLCFGGADERQLRCATLQ